MSEDGRRSTAEWVTFAVSAVILLVVVGLLVGQIGASEEPPSPIASVDTTGIVERAGGFYVPVEVHNDGDRGAAAVQVTADLTIDGNRASADQTIDVLGADERKRLVFVFADDPSAGTLEVTVGGFAVP